MESEFPAAADDLASVLAVQAQMVLWAVPLVTKLVASLKNALRSSTLTFWHGKCDVSASFTRRAALRWHARSRSSCARPCDVTAPGTYVGRSRARGLKYTCSLAHRLRSSISWPADGHRLEAGPIGVKTCDSAASTTIGADSRTCKMGCRMAVGCISAGVCLIGSVVRSRGCSAWQTHGLADGAHQLHVVEYRGQVALCFKRPVEVVVHGPGCANDIWQLAQLRVVMPSVTGFFLNVKSRRAASDTKYWYVYGALSIISALVMS